LLVRAVSDTSPFIALHSIGRLGLLPQLFDTITVPAAVAAELKSILLRDWVRAASVPHGAMVRFRRSRKRGWGVVRRSDLSGPAPSPGQALAGRWGRSEGGAAAGTAGYGCARTAGGCQTNRASPGGSPGTGQVANFRIPRLGGPVQGTSGILWRDLSPVFSSRAATRRRGIAEPIEPLADSQAAAASERRGWTKAALEITVQPTPSRSRLRMKRFRAVHFSKRFSGSAQVEELFPDTA
jgi:hypothetical protein